MTEPTPMTGGISVPSWLIPPIGAVGTFIAGGLVAEDLTSYWRPALVPVVGALVAIFVARPVAKQRLAAARRSGEIAGADFGQAATYAQVLADAPEAPPARKRTTKKAATKAAPEP